MAPTSEKNFHPARARKPAGPPPPGSRGQGRAPAAALPGGVAPPGTRTGRADRPEAYIPYTGPAYPNGHVGMVGLCMAVVGVATMVDPMTMAGWFCGLGFTLLGVTIGVIWIRLWLLWRAAWGKGKWA